MTNAKAQIKLKESMSKLGIIRLNFDLAFGFCNSGFLLLTLR